MRIAGIDPSSTICGLALIETPSEVQSVAHWKRDTSKSHPQGFVDYFNWLGRWLYSCKPQMAIVEMHSYTGPKSNAQATQAVAYYQAISVLCCKLNGIVVIESRASTARKVVLGHGGLSKDEVWERMRTRYPDLFSSKRGGGLDEMDALVLALAGSSVAER